MWGTTARRKLNTPVKLAAITHCRSSSVCSHIKAAGPAIPAVYQDVYLTGLFQYLVYSPAHRGRIGNIRFDGERTSVEPQPLAALRLDSGRSRPRSLPPQSTGGDGFADAGRGSGNDGSSAAKLNIVGLSAAAFGILSGTHCRGL